MPRPGGYRMACGLRGFVTFTKYSLKNRAFVGRGSRQKAQNPLIQAIIMQFTIISHKSRFVKRFLENISNYFSAVGRLTKIDKNCAHLRTSVRAWGRHADPLPAFPRQNGVFPTLFSRNSRKTCLQTRKYMVYYYNPYLYFEEGRTPFPL